MKKIIQTAARWQESLAHRRIPDLVVYGLALFSMVLGIVFLTTPDRFYEADTFDAVFAIASPQVWGLAYIITSVFLGLGFWSTRTGGRQAALVMVILYVTFASLSSINPFGGNGVFSALVIYLFCAYMSVVAMLACTIPKDPKWATNPSR